LKDKRPFNDLLNGLFFFIPNLGDEFITHQTLNCFRPGWVTLIPNGMDKALQAAALF
jgi:hypothetical protein